MKIILAGYGFVGQAVASCLKDTVICIVDPKYNSSKISNYLDSDGVIICVGTPSTQLGDCDVSQIYDVLRQIPASMPVLIKSTVRPDYLIKITKDFAKHTITYSPEFLRAATATEDFASQEFLILGGQDPDQMWQNLFERSLKNLNKVVNCSLTEAAMLKYTLNCFLSIKLTYFNQIYDMCKINGANYDSIIDMLKLDQRVGSSHMQVPGPDGNRGFGGHCFPKDTNAFIHYSDQLGVINTLVELAVKYNKKIKKSLT